MDPRQWGSPFPSSSNFPPSPDCYFDEQEVWQTTNFTGLLMEGMGGMSLNNMPAYHSYRFEGGANSDSQSNTYNFAMADGNTSACTQQSPQDIVASSHGIVTNLASEQVRLQHEAIAYACVRTQAQRERLPYHTSSLRGAEYVKELLDGRDERFYQNFRMTKSIFLELCELLSTKYGWVSQSNDDGVSVEESLAMFICVLRGWVIDDIDDRYQRSRSTVHRHVDKILDCMIEFQNDEIVPTFSTDEAYIHPYLCCREPYRCFQNCIGAIDGTHVACRPPPNQGALYFSRKGGYTMNIMAACDFNLRFTFASVGWQGTWHDYAIFKEVMRDDATYQFPHPPPGKYYLVDSGYANRTGYLAPYKGCKYHLEDFRRGEREVREGEELFNRWHSSLRCAIERCFGVWKKRWRFLNNNPTYCVKKQTRLIMASMAIHNFIRRRCPQDELWRNFDWRHAPDSVPEDPPVLNEQVLTSEDTDQQERDADCDDYMNTFRDSIKGALNEQFQRRRRGF